MSAKEKRDQRAANRSMAMGHTVRAAAFRVLANEGPANPAEIARKIGKGTPLVTHHVKQLVKFGCAELVERKIDGGNVKNVYRAIEPHLIETEEWEDLPAEVKESSIGEFAQAHVDHLVLALGDGLGKDKFFHVTGDRYSLDQEGFERFMEITEEARLAFEAEAVAADKRIAEDGAVAKRVASMLGCFEIPGVD
jgi:hypothetical protein